MGGSLSKPEPRAHGIDVLLYPALVLICALLTLLYGRVVAPRLSRRDPLAKALGMVGFALLLLGLMKERWDTSKPRNLSFPTDTFELFGAVVSTTQVLALALSIVVVVGVTFVLQKTKIGTAMRAVANDREVAAMLGVPVRQIESIAWFGSGVICGLVFLLLPNLFKSMDQGTLTWFVVGALGGAIIGQFRSLWITFAASIGIGVVESVLTPFDGNLQFLADYRKTSPFVISVLAILWISRKRTVVLAGREMR
jgi:branched-chain amino acid transport system permease protein